MWRRHGSEKDDTMVLVTEFHYRDGDVGAYDDVDVAAVCTISENQARSFSHRDSAGHRGGSAFEQHIA